MVLSGAQPPQTEPVLAPEITRAPVTALAVGLVGGTVCGFLGIGGGLVLSPALMLMLRIRKPRAAGTSLLVAVLAAALAAWRYHEARPAPGPLPLWAVVWLVLGSILGALAGAGALAGGNSPRLKRAAGGLAAVAGMLMIAGFEPVRADPAAAGAWTWHLAVGTLAGVASSLLATGGGMALVPCLVLLLGWTEHVAQGVSLALIVPVSLATVLVHAARGTVVWSLAGWLTGGALLGAWCGAGWALRLAEPLLQALFGVAMVALGVHTVSRAAGKRAAPAE